MKLTFLHGLLLVAGLAAVREIAFPNNSIPDEPEEILDFEPPTIVSKPKIKKNPEPFIPKPNFERREPEEIFIPAFKKPDQPTEPRTSPNVHQKLIEKVRDYTVKLVWKNNFYDTYTWGTGWFLDYALPSRPGKYPTKWFVATNAHVAEVYHFHKDPYKQIPKTREFFYGQWDLYLYRWETGGYDEEIFRRKGMDLEEPTVWSSEEAKKHHPYPFSFNISSFPPSRDVLTTQKHWHRNKETPSMHLKIADPKLLYAAIDDKINDYWGNPFDSYMDFAVLEIDFPTEESARRMTKQVYHKPEKEMVNFLGEANENSQFYTAGYPGNSFNHFRPVGNYSPSGNRASRKFNCHVLNDNALYLQEWNKKKYRNDRCYYQLDYFYSQGGASGSMVIDKDGTLLGLVSRGDKENKLGYIQPIRGRRKDCWSSWFCSGELEYDLIVGSPHQRTSYRQQLLRYLPRTNTFLKSKYGWKETPLSRI